MLMAMVHEPSPSAISPQPLTRASAQVLVELMIPVRPVVAAERAPVVEVMANAAARQDGRHSIGFVAALPWPAAGHEVDVARRQVAELPWVGCVRHLIDRVVEVEIVV